MRFSSSPFRTSTVMATALVVLAASMPDFAFAAKRLGGGGSVGRQQSGISQRQAEPMQRSTTPNAAPAQQAAPGAPASPAAAPGAAAAPAGAAASPAAAQRPAAGAQTPGAPAQQPARNRWLGPLAGLAAGIGLAALFSHLGLGDELASFMSSFLMIALLVVAAVFIFRLLTRSRRQSASTSGPYAYADASTGDATATPGGGWQGTGTRSEPAMQTAPLQRTSGSGLGSSAAAPLGAELNVFGQPVGSANPASGFEVAAADAPLIDLPEQFDTAGFLRAARGVFVKLQAANDAGDVATLREFVSDDLLAIFQDEIRNRGIQAQATEVVALESELVAYEREWDEHIASVLFTGSIREAAGTPAESFQEIWNLSRPTRHSGGWTLVGIQSV